MPEAEPLLDEAINFAAAQHAGVDFAAHTQMDFIDARCAALGEAWEPDFLLLKPAANGPPRLVCGCVCFPSLWSLPEKIGQPVHVIHEPAPGLNAELGKAIASFLDKLRPGACWRRDNWGLSRTAELNYHPSRGLPVLDETVRSDEVWLRLEHQAFASLPGSGGILFAIRIAVHPLAEVIRDARAARGLSRALRTMPEAMASYKRLDTARHAIAAMLEM